MKLPFQRFALLIVVIALSLMFQNCGQGFATGETDAATDATSISGTEICTIATLQGTQLVSAALTSTACESECAALNQSNPLLQCTWNLTDITPENLCVISTATGGQLVSGTSTYASCYNSCGNEIASLPSAVCRWNGTAFTY